MKKFIVVSLIAIPLLAGGSNVTQATLFQESGGQPTEAGDVDSRSTQSPDSTARPLPDDFVSDCNFTEGIRAEVLTTNYCPAGTKIEDTQALGGFGASDNYPVAISNEEAKSLGYCYLLALPDVAVNLGESKGLTLVLVNSTADSIQFDACDSAINIIQEANDEEGNWRPIQSLPQSGCGNSYHRVGLGANEYWSFAQPRFEGTFQTRLRFVLLVDNEIALISNEFAGGIFPGQFEPAEDAEADRLNRSPDSIEPKMEEYLKADSTDNGK